LLSGEFWKELWIVLPDAFGPAFVPAEEMREGAHD
jgi:hypothetical protein